MSKRIRSFLLFTFMVTTSFYAIANSLDEYAKAQVAKNLVANEVMLMCRGEHLTEADLIQASKVQIVDDKKVLVVTKLTGCHYSSIISSFYYKKDVTKIIGMRSARAL